MAVGTGDEYQWAGGDETPLGSAVLFFRDGRLVTELRDAEFQSLLGGVAALSDLGGGERCGVYCEVAPGLVARAMVFFRIAFDAAGRPDQAFTIPLPELARRGGAGPDLGFGRIRLATQNQCPIPWLANRLWQPRSLSQEGECGVVQRALQKNRLGFRNGSGRRRDPGATFDGRATMDGRSVFDGRATLDSRAVTEMRQTLDNRAPTPAAPSFGATMGGADTLSNFDSRLSAVDGRLVVPQLVRQYQARIDALEAERLKAREQLHAVKGEVSRLAEELAQERERSRRLERMLRGSDME